MKIQNPTVGPIVGYTTETESRIFIRGELLMDDTGPRRSFGAVRWRKAAGGKKTATWSGPIVNKLSPNFDLTAVFALEDLLPSTDYEYQTGWFYADVDLEQIEKMAPAIEWPDPSIKGNVNVFRSGSNTPGDARTFAIGSCRYMLRLFGGTWFDDRGDKVFRTILEQTEKLGRIDGLVMAGDQIYADDLNFVSPDMKVDEFLKRYRTVFSQKHVRELMSSVPTYMILDDHEIEDNWPAKASELDLKVLYPHAIHAYQIYQCSHGPLFEAERGRIEGTLSHFWYKFRDGCSDWFVMDVRTERRPEQAEIISQDQMTALCDWLLTANDGRVRFIVTSVPMFPDMTTDNTDKWQGFATQRHQLLEFIRTNAVQKVVFVSGDVHCSFVAKLTSSTDPGFAVHTVVSSSFFWPYPHMDQSQLKLGTPLQAPGGAPSTYVADFVQMTKVVSDDNFARMEVSPNQVRVSFYERKGEQQGPTVTFAV